MSTKNADKKMRKEPAWQARAGRNAFTYLGALQVSKGDSSYIPKEYSLFPKLYWWEKLVSKGKDFYTCKEGVVRV